MRTRKRSRAKKLKRIRRSYQFHPYTLELLELLNDSTGKTYTWLLELALWQAFAEGLLQDRLEMKSSMKQLNKILDSKFLAKGHDLRFLYQINYFKKTDADWDNLPPQYSHLKKYRAGKRYTADEYMKHLESLIEAEGGLPLPRSKVIVANRNGTDTERVGVRKKLRKKSA